MKNYAKKQNDNWRHGIIDESIFWFYSDLYDKSKSTLYRYHTLPDVHLSLDSHEPQIINQMIVHLAKISVNLKMVRTPI